MAFLDEEDSLPPVATEPDPHHDLPPERQRVFMLRRVTAVVVGILILILLVLGIRGCLDARKERALSNYARDLSALTSESNQLSQTFFDHMQSPGNLTELEFETEIKADRSSAEALVGRAESLDPPGEVDAAQSRVVQAFELRRDGLASVADNIGAALGDEERDEAVERITLHMQDFVASDVLYRQARDEIDTVLSEQGIGEQVPESVFLPDFGWLEQSTVTQNLAGITGEGGDTSAIRGLGISSVSIAGVTLSADGSSTVSADGTPEIEVQVANQGEADESDVPVQVTVSGGDQPVDDERTIRSIATGETKSVTIPLDPAPSPGTTVTLEVFVEPVLGEQVVDNNEFTSEVTFE